jgi:hypothetical protein
MKTKRRKKYNKKSFKKKTLRKKSFRKQSYKKKTLRKTFNKKKFRNLKGGTGWLQYSPDGTRWLQYSPYGTGWSRIHSPIYDPRYGLGRYEYELSMPRQNQQNLNRSYVDEITTSQNAERGRRWLNFAIASRDNDRRNQAAAEQEAAERAAAARREAAEQEAAEQAAADAAAADAAAAERAVAARREEVANNWGRKNVLSSAARKPRLGNRKISSVTVNV